MLIFPYVLLKRLQEISNTNSLKDTRDTVQPIILNDTVKHVSKQIDRYINTKFLRRNLFEKGSTEDKLNSLFKQTYRQFIKRYDFKSNSITECVCLSIVSNFMNIKDVKNDEVINNIENVMTWIGQSLKTRHNTPSNRLKSIKNLEEEILPRVYTLGKILEMGTPEKFSSENRIRWLINFLNTMSQITNDRVVIASRGIVEYRWIYHKIEKIIYKECKKLLNLRFFKKWLRLGPNIDAIDKKIKEFITCNKEKSPPNIKNVIEDLIVSLYMATHEINSKEEEYVHFKEILKIIADLKQNRRQPCN